MSLMSFSASKKNEDTNFIALTRYAHFQLGLQRQEKQRTPVHAKAIKRNENAYIKKEIFLRFQDRLKNKKKSDLKPEYEPNDKVK